MDSINNKEEYKKRAIVYMVVMDTLIAALLIIGVIQQGNLDNSEYALCVVPTFMVVFSAIFYGSLNSRLRRVFPNAAEYTKGEITSEWSFMFSCTLAGTLVVYLYVFEENTGIGTLILSSILTLTVLNGILFFIGKLIAFFIAPDGYYPWDNFEQKMIYLQRREVKRQAVRDAINRKKNV